MADVVPTPDGEPSIHRSARRALRNRGAFVLSKLQAVWRERIDSCLFPACVDAPETGRRARLIVRFGFLGFVFGLIYASFYLAIGHRWGAAIIVVCSLGFVAMPFLLRATRSLPLAGNILVGIMAACFAALSAIEGGLFGHAIAWLVTVP